MSFIVTPINPAPGLWPGATAQLDVGSLPSTNTYDGSNRLITSYIDFNGLRYTQTFTYTGSNLTAVSGWVVGAIP